MVNAGYTIQQLAKRRKKESIKKFASALILFLAPAFPYLNFGITRVSLLIHIACLVMSIVYLRKGERLLLASQKASLGAEAEKSVALILLELEREGWQIEYNISLRYWGDADAFLRSPQGNCFVVDTKGNGGTVFFDGTKLMLCYGRKVHSFSNDKDILKAVKGQAATLKEIYRVPFVTPILCFTNASLNIKTIDNKIENVYILTHHSLISVLRLLDM